ncbi:MAG: hypothetical protein CUN55_00540 [Phototrophicales bacterium]|nr:MAG: hypothetical protein CUN55_00540 [Phototrophicales bacterium]
MTRVSIKPVIKDFQIELPEGVANITIRQARTGDVMRRGEFFAESTLIYDDAQVGRAELKQKRNSYEIRAFEVQATLVGADLEDEEGNPIFRFREGKNGPELNMSDREFLAAWGALPVHITDAIYDCVLEMNPMWDINRLGE